MTERAPDSRTEPTLEVVALVRSEGDEEHSVRIIKCSAAGLLVATARGFTTGAVHEFRFLHGRPSQVLLFQARVVQVMTVNEAGQWGYVARLEFLPPRTAQQRLAIARVLQACRKRRNLR
jgi:hypothetical protein